MKSRGKSCILSVQLTRFVAFLHSMNEAITSFLILLLFVTSLTDGFLIDATATSQDSVGIYSYVDGRSAICSQVFTKDDGAILLVNGSTFWVNTTTESGSATNTTNSSTATSPMLVTSTPQDTQAGYQRQQPLFPSDEFAREVVIENVTVSSQVQLVVNMTNMLVQSMMRTALNLYVNRVLRSSTDAVKFAQSSSGKRHWNSDGVSVTVKYCSFHDSSNLAVFADENVAVKIVAQWLQGAPINLNGKDTLLDEDNKTIVDSLDDKTTETQATLIAKHLVPASVILNVTSNSFTNAIFFVAVFSVPRAPVGVLLIEKNTMDITKMIDKTKRPVPSGSHFMDTQNLWMINLGIGMVQVKGKNSGLGIVANTITCMELLTTSLMCWNIMMYDGKLLRNGGTFYVRENNFTAFSHTIPRGIQIHQGAVSLTHGSFFSFGPNNRFDQYLPTLASDCYAINFNNAPLIVREQSVFTYFKNFYNGNCAPSQSTALIRFIYGATSTCNEGTYSFYDNYSRLRSSGRRDMVQFRVTAAGDYGPGEAYFTACNVVFANNVVVPISSTGTKMTVVSGRWYSDAATNVSVRCNVADSQTMSSSMLPKDNLGAQEYNILEEQCETCNTDMDCIRENARDVVYNKITEECVCDCANNTVPPLCSEGLIFPLEDGPPKPVIKQPNLLEFQLPRTNSSSLSLSSSRSLSKSWSQSMVPTASDPKTLSPTRRTPSVSASPSKRTTTVSPTTTNLPTPTVLPTPQPTPAPEKKTVQELREEFKGCAEGTAPLLLSSPSNTTIKVSVDDIRSVGVQIELRITSCHWFNKSYSVTEPFVSNSEDRGDDPTLETTQSSAGTSLIDVIALRTDIIQQQFIAKGKILRVKIGPYPEYDPPGPDGLLLSRVDVETGASSMVSPTPLPDGNQSVPSILISVDATAKPVPNPTTKEVVASGTTTTGYIGSALGGSAMAGAAQRQALLTNVAQCPRELETAELSSEAHPLGFSLGSAYGVFGFHLGAVLGNVALIVSVLGLHFLIACGLCLFRRVPLSTSIAWVRFPARSLPITTLLMQGALTSAFTVAILSESWMQVTVAVLAAGFIGFLCVIMFLILLRGPQTFDTRYEEKDLNGRSVAALFTMNVGRWVPRKAKNERFLRMYGPLFEDFKPGSAQFFLVDVVVMVLSAYMMAMVPNTATRCNQVFSCVVALFILYALVMVATRPFLSTINNVLFCATAVCQALSAGALYIAYYYNNARAMTTSEQLNLAVLGLQILTTVFSFGKAVVDWKNDDLQPDKAIRQHKQVLEAAKSTKEKELLFSFLSAVPQDKLPEMSEIDDAAAEVAASQ